MNTRNITAWINGSHRRWRTNSPSIAPAHLLVGRAASAEGMHRAMQPFSTFRICGIPNPLGFQPGER
jgi:hypothetical protein